VTGARPWWSLRRFALLTLGFNLAVIVWGGYVRASGSGAGCGRHWPLCNGEVVPAAPAAATAIEFTHRLTSGIALTLVLFLAIWAFRSRPAGSRLRKAAAWSVVLILIEALVGAGLVLLELVGDDSSALRAGYLAVHLGNTFALLAALTLTVLWAEQPVVGGWAFNGMHRSPETSSARLTLVALGLVVIVAMTGAVTALGDTLFPAESLGAGLRDDGSPTAHFLIRLRVIHPVLAVVTAIVVLAAATAVVRAGTGTPAARAARWFGGLMIVQVAIGTINLVLLVPIATQLLHLLVADLVWVAGVVMVVGGIGIANGE
jgi:heme A synthase